MARDDLHFRLRIPEALKARIEKSAAENHHSMTAEIISRLERSYEIDSTLEETVETVSEIYARLDRVEAMVRDHEERFNPGKYHRD